MDTHLITKPSLTLRVGIGKLVGLIIGAIGLFLLPVFYAEADWAFRWGILLWYTTLGAVVGIFGVYTRHPVLKLPFAWWFRAPIIGAWFNFVLALFIHEKLMAVMAGLAGGMFVFPSPAFWFVVEGAIVGALIGWAATHFGGEGPETVGQ